MGEETTRIVSTEQRTYSDDAQLSDYLFLGWRYRWLILALTVIGGLLGLIASRTLPVSYEAETVVAPAPGRAGQPGAMTAADLQALFRNQALAAKVLSDLGLDKPPVNLSAREFVADHVVLETVPSTNMLRVRVTLDRPDGAAKTANDLVRQGVIFSLETIRSESVINRDRLRTEMDKATARLDDAVTRLVKFRAANQFTIGFTDIEQLAPDRVKAGIDVKTQEVKIAVLERELKLLRPANSAYERLQYRLAVERSQLAAIAERHRLLSQPTRTQHTKGQPTSSPAQETQLNIARANYAAAQANYNVLVAKYQDAELDAESPAPPFQVVDEAQTPTAPLPRGTLRLSLIGIFLGMFAAITVALALNYYQTLTVRMREA